MKKIISIVLLVSMIFTVMSFPANAATTVTEEAFVSKITTLKSKYPHNKYWNEYNGTETIAGKSVAKAGNSICSGVSNYDNATCTTHGYCAYNGYSCTCKCGYFYGWQCFGFANLMAYYVFGSYATTGYNKADVNSGKGWNYLTSVSTFYAGDVVRINNNHSIFIYKVTDSDVYYVECNYTGPCKINWNGQKTIKNLKSITTFVVRMSGNTLKGNGQTKNTLTIKYHANGGTIDSQITSWTYKVTESIGINMRSDAGTGYSVVTALPQNTTFTVKNGETKTANGYTWGKTTYGGKTGWVVISDFVTKTSTNRNTDFYLSSSMVYRSSNSSVVTEQKNYGEDMPTGLYNVTTFGMTREGYRFVGWCTKSDGSATIFDQNDNTIKPETIYPNLKNGSATITVYAIWECTHSYSNNCDFDCNVCGVKREVKHNFTDGKNCELCGCELRDLADLNVDGEINVLDIARLKMILAGEMKVYIVSPDLDGDGSVSANDLTILMEFILADF